MKDLKEKSSLISNSFLKQLLIFITLKRVETLSKHIVTAQVGSTSSKT